MKPFDVNGARVHGIISGQKVRAFWRDGKLYVASNPPLKVESIETTEPQRWGGGWKLMAGTSSIMVQPTGCGMCKQKVLSGKVLSQEEIMGMADAT